RRLEAAGRHRGVGIDMHQTIARRRLADALDVIDRMTERDGFECGGWCLCAREHGEALMFEDALDRAQPVRPLRMAHWGDVVETGRMGEQKGGHGARCTQILAARLTPAGGLSPSGTKKSGVSASRGSTR